MPDTEKDRMLMTFHLPLCSLHTGASQADCRNRTPLGDGVYLCSLFERAYAQNVPETSCEAQRFCLINAVVVHGRIIDVRMMKKSGC